MSELILYVYIVFSYLYMAHRVVTKVKDGVPDDIKNEAAMSSFVVVAILCFSPISFVVHVATAVKKSITTT